MSPIPTTLNAMTPLEVKEKENKRGRKRRRKEREREGGREGGREGERKGKGEREGERKREEEREAKGGRKRGKGRKKERKREEEREKQKQKERYVLFNCFTLNKTTICGLNRDNIIKHSIKSLQLLYYTNPCNHVLQVIVLPPGIQTHTYTKFTQISIINCTYYITYAH